ncbi:MAG: metal-dependent hydrolase [Candidatus Nanohaloarchaea archaeon]|nr:metal-dependent hydrolase [Candidatus Nanohaloarchaea archaeon]
MPTYRDHLLTGSMLSAVFLYLFSPFLRYTPEMVVSTTAFILLASIFPDIDHANSVVHRSLKAFLVLILGGTTALLAFPDLLTMLSAGIQTGTGIYVLFEHLKPHHRTITHTYRFAVIYSLGVGLFCLLFLQTFAPAIFSLIAYLSHLLIDGTIQF